MIIIWIHDATQNYSMSVLYKQKIYSIELERLVWIKTWIYKNRNNNIFREQYKIWQHTNISKDTLTLWDYWVYLMFKYFSDFLWFNKDDIDLLVISSWKNYSNIFWDKKYIVPKSHHIMHLYSCYFLSWFSESNILIIDWAWYNITEKHIDLQSMYFWQNKNIELVKSNFAQKDKNIWIWIAYDRVSVFLWLTEWKVMWLTWYSQVYKKYNFFDLLDWEVYLRKDLHEVFCNRELFLEYFWILDEFLNNWYLSEKIINFVNSFQKEVEDAILYLADFLYEKNNCENLCYSGWVALNCLTNYRLKNELKYKNIFIQPAAGDSGISLWNLLYWYYEYLLQVEKIELSNNNYWLWIDYKNFIDDIISEYEDYLEFEKLENEDDLINTISEKLFSKNTCIVFKWWSEFWPRALGNRSIISSINIQNLQYKINKIKDREYWRPFWLMILKEDQEKYFENSVDSEYMLYTNRLNDSWIPIYKNICHNDKTIRLQTIKNDNQFYYKLLNRLDYYWIKWLLNTSLNWKWEPILETPKQALEFFLLRDWISYLLLENCIITKKTNKKFVTKKLSNITLIESIINNIKTIVTKKTNIPISNIFIDLDIFTKKISISIIDNNIILCNLLFLYEDNKYILHEKKQKNDIDFSILIANVVNNVEFLNKLFWVVRWVFMK